MAETFADAFTQNYGAMQQNQRANQQLSDQETAAIAERAYKQALLGQQQQELQWKMDPTNPQNVYLQAHAKELTELGPSRERAAERRAQATENAAESRQKAQDFRTAMDTIFNRGGLPSVAIAGLDDETAQKVKDAVMAAPMADYNAKLKAYNDNQAARQQGVDDLTELYGMIGQNPTLGKSDVPSQAAKSIFGGPAGAVSGEAQPQNQDWVQQQINQVSANIPHEVPHPGPAPTWEQIGSQPIITPQQQALINQRNATERLRNSQAARTDALALLDPEYKQSQIDRNNAVAKYEKERIPLMQKAEKWKEFYQGGQLNQQAARTAIQQGRLSIAQQNANTYARANDPAVIAAKSDAALARSIIKGEVDITQKQLSKFDDQASQARQQLKQLNDAVDAAGDSNNIMMPNGKTITKDQANAAGQALISELDPRNPTSAAYRANQMRTKLNGDGTDANPGLLRLQSPKDTPGIDQFAINPKTGNQYKTPSKVGGLKTYSPQDARNLPKGTHFLGTDGKEYVVR